ncbi:DUF5916 domain-containing protein [Flavobacterium urocaniciphilum]|uniref:Carbohydrate family 9 binding domain-like n=1 Tax=Flavobacterium urocaniciphilum TaxID=1299341 RepID=A0A1H9AQ38_9FLAO|nr:DUF5916 domain-containing protein [Flavobacterium urocaniciphilum]SEP78028.1 Carbohydrate family 9 binding domain-like [Flavobacterium urocaniciphilum]
MKVFKIISLALISQFSFAQESLSEIEKKKVSAIKTSSSIKIDGNLDESDWQNVPVAKNFVMFDPDNGKPEREELRSEVKVLYDNDAVYIGATLYDNEPDKILKEITERDDFGAADFFGVFINGFNDGQHEYSFFVNTSSGQADCIRTNQGEDFSWDAIWHSEAKVTNLGWQVEMKIPYAALRFSKEDIQKWGIQFFREVRRLRQKFTWNPVDNRKGSFTQQAGELEGISNVQTPTRLFLIPYSSFYLNSFGKEKSFGTLKGGLDLKYGLTDAFTLDMVLIPDFGQTKFDNKILNLGPFEQVFNENRPFFTEGTDLFSKGGLFYSRRIGQGPSTYPNTSPTEEVVEYPNAVDLVNAVKVSGRTNDGLGIGFLNTVTKKTDVVIRDVVTGDERIETVEPLANYNVMVVDQRFNGNSSVSLINTNVTRDGEFRDANVTATAFNLSTKKNTYNTNGVFRYSYVNDYKDLDNKKGISSNLNFSETAGKVRFSVGGEYVSEDYDNNDLGINFQTNYFALNGSASYRSLKPTEKLNSYRINFSTYNQFDNRTHFLQDQNFNINANFTNKKNHAAGFGFNINPFERYNFYNPQVEGRYVIFPKNYGTWAWISTNYNNKFALDLEPNIGFAEAKGWWYWGLNVSPRYRFNDKFLLIYRNNFYNEYQDLGRVAQNGDDIVFAKRDNQTLETGLEGKYSINAQMNFGLRLRHYWSFSENNSYYKLLENGRVEEYAYTNNRNSNFNSWNFDLSYSWWFAPGSQMSVLYRSNAGIFQREIDKDLSYQAKQVFNHEQLNHTFSISLRYFIDYNQAKNVFKGKA